MLYHNGNRFQSKYLPVRVSITSELKSNKIISPVQLCIGQICPAHLDTMFTVIRASKHAYTLSLGSKNFVTDFILLSRRCP